MLLRRLLASVRVRVTAAAFLAVACALGVSAAIIESSLSHDRQHVLIATAEEQANEVTQLNPLLTPPLDLPPRPTLQTGLVQVVRSDGKLLGESGPLGKLPPQWQPGDPEFQHNSFVFAGQAQDVHVVSVPVVVNKKLLDHVVVITSLDQYDKSLAYVQRLLATGMPILLVVVGLIAWVVVARALRPIEAMRREVTEIATIPGSHRVPEPATKDEVGRLARTLNSMLDRIEASSARERRFVSDASHELRSPIANIRTELEVAMHRPEQADWVSVAREVLAQNERMGHLVQELLLLARSDEGGLQPTTEVTDLGAVAESVAGGFDGDGPPVLVHATGAPVAVPVVYLERVVTNLVDNARRYAATHVEVSVARQGRTAVLRVADDGPGIPEEDRIRIFERFVRLDEARDRGDGGFGLGLAIVADVCRAYRGTVEISDADPGALFTLRFPLARASRIPGRSRRPVPV
jgi:signal transduction histidine kinase